MGDKDDPSFLQEGVTPIKKNKAVVTFIISEPLLKPPVLLKSERPFYWGKAEPTYRTGSEWGQEKGEEKKDRTGCPCRGLGKILETVCFRPR